MDSQWVPTFNLEWPSPDFQEQRFIFLHFLLRSLYAWDSMLLRSSSQIRPPSIFHNCKINKLLFYGCWEFVSVVVVPDSSEATCGAIFKVIANREMEWGPRTRIWEPPTLKSIIYTCVSSTYEKAMRLRALQRPGNFIFVTPLWGRGCC